MKRAKMCDRTPARRRRVRTSRAAFMIASPGAAVTTTWWNSNVRQATVGARGWQTAPGTRLVRVETGGRQVGRRGGGSLRGAPGARPGTRRREAGDGRGPGGDRRRPRPALRRGRPRGCPGGGGRPRGAARHAGAVHLRPRGPGAVRRRGPRAHGGLRQAGDPAPRRLAAPPPDRPAQRLSPRPHRGAPGAGQAVRGSAFIRSAHAAAPEPGGPRWGAEPRGPRPGRVRRVFQLVPFLEPGDAIGNHARRFAAALGPAHGGYIVERASGEHARTATPFTRAEVDPDDVLVYHVAHSSRLGDWLAGVKAIKVIDYHNITPPEFYRAYDPGLAVALGRALGELESLRSEVALALAHSEYSRRELGAMGFVPTAAVPVPLDFSRLDAACAPVPEALRAG